MSCDITYSPRFARELKKLSKHYKSLKLDYANLLESLKANPEQLPAEEGGRLEDVDVLGDDGDLLLGVHVGDDGHADDLADLGEDLEALLHPQTAEAGVRGAVGLVVAGLEDVGDPELVGDLLHGRGDVDGHLLSFENAGAGQKEERSVQADVKTTELH